MSSGGFRNNPMISESPKSLSMMSEEVKNTKNILLESIFENAGIEMNHIHPINVTDNKGIDINIFIP